MSRHNRVDAVSTPPPGYDEVVSQPDRYQLRREQTRLFIVAPESDDLYNSTTGAVDYEPPRPVTVGSVAAPIDPISLTTWNPHETDHHEQYGLNEVEKTPRPPGRLPKLDRPSYGQSGRSQVPVHAVTVGVNGSQTVDEEAAKLEWIAAKAAAHAARVQAAKDRAARQQATREQAAIDEAARERERAREEQSAETGEEARRQETVAERVKQIPFLLNLLWHLAVQILLMLILTAVFTFVDSVVITNEVLIAFGTLTGFTLCLVALARTAKEQGAERVKKVSLLPLFTLIIPAVLISLVAGRFHLQGLVGTYGVMFIIIQIGLNRLKNKPEVFTKGNHWLVLIAGCIFVSTVITLVVIFTMVDENSVELLRENMLLHVPINETVITQFWRPTEILNNSEIIQFRLKHNEIVRERILDYTFDEMKLYMQIQMLFWYLIPVGLGPLAIILLFGIAHTIKYREFKHNQETLLINYTMECLLSWTIIPLSPIFICLPKNPPS